MVVGEQGLAVVVVGVGVLQEYSVWGVLLVAE